MQDKPGMKEFYTHSHSHTFARAAICSHTELHVDMQLRYAGEEDVQI